MEDTKRDKKRVSVKCDFNKYGGEQEENRYISGQESHSINQMRSGNERRETEQNQGTFRRGYKVVLMSSYY